MGTLLADLKHYLANTPKEQVDRDMDELEPASEGDITMNDLININMFKQDCFIRIANNLSLVHDVSMMGYQPLYLYYKYNLMGKNLVLEHGTWHYTDSDNHPGAIDCGTNRELFLGIAAMNDENDKDQYFTCAEDPGRFILCTKDRLEQCFTYNVDLDLADGNWQLYRKVTPQELVDYFNRQTTIQFHSNASQIGKD